MPSELIENIIKDIAAGLPTDKTRLHKASKALDFYKCDYERHWKFTEERELTPRRTCALLTHVIDQNANVNKEQPSRVVNNDPEATEFLSKTYSDNKMYALLPEAERLAAISQVAAFQVCGSDDPERPIKIHLWDASSLVVYFDPDDFLKVVGVVTIDSQDDVTKRYQVWTDTEYVVFTVKDDKSGEAEPDLLKAEANPYNCLPFAFAHYRVPTLDFWCGSPGNHLVHATEYVNRRLSKMGAACEFLTEPITLIRNARPDWNPGKPRPGDWLPIPASTDNSQDDEHNIHVEHLQPDMDFVYAGIDDINFFIDMVLEQHGIPLSATRMTQSTARSGNSIMMESWPLASARKSKQSHWRQIEIELARVVFRVAGEHFKQNNIENAERWSQVSKDLNLTVTYTEVFLEVPGAERDRANEWEMQHGLKSLVQVYMERTGTTREEAEAHLKQVEADNEVFRLPVANQAVQDQQDDSGDVLEQEETEENFTNDEEA